MTETTQNLAVETVGTNRTRLWGLTMAERTRRIAAEVNLEVGGGAPVLLVNSEFAADPSWIRHIAAHPGMLLAEDGVPALAHARTTEEAKVARKAMEASQSLTQSERAGFEVLEYREKPTIEDKKLRKRETPFLLPLRPATRPAVERASYFGAYKGVTDLLTKYLWPEWALWLTRLAARWGMTPNMVTAIGAAFCVAAPIAFADGRYWLGMALALVFMVLDTVDGKLARCTITSSWWGNIFDHGLDLIHPPFWYWFWGTGLVHWGLGLKPDTFVWIMTAIIAGYVVQRLIEGVFMRQHGGMHIHVWRRFDSRFRLVTARRNPNMVILFVSVLFGRPDVGLLAVAGWTVLSCLVHAVRLLQATRAARRHGSLTSWLAET